MANKECLRENWEINQRQGISFRSAAEIIFVASMLQFYLRSRSIALPQSDPSVAHKNSHLQLKSSLVSEINVRCCFEFLIWNYFVQQKSLKCLFISIKMNERKSITICTYAYGHRHIFIYKGTCMNHVDQQVASARKSSK